VTKPFSPREVLARVRAVLRRLVPEASAPHALHLREAELDLGAHRLCVSGQSVELTPSELGSWAR